MACPASSSTDESEAGCVRLGRRTPAGPLASLWLPSAPCCFIDPSQPNFLKLASGLRPIRRDSALLSDEMRGCARCRVSATTPDFFTGPPGCGPTMPAGAVRVPERGTRRGAEMFATGTPPELQAVIDRIEAKGRGEPVGEQMLTDAHCGMPRTTVTTVSVGVTPAYLGGFRSAPATDILSPGAIKLGHRAHVRGGLHR